MENTLEQSTIKKIFGILEEHADQKWDEVDWLKVSTEIYEVVLSDVVKKLVKKDLEIAESIKSLGRCVTCGADAYREFVFTGKPHMCKVNHE